MNKRKIWIMNHYATNSYFNRGGRHYWFAKNLTERGYDVTIFCASTRHNSSDNIEMGQSMCCTDSVDGIKFVFVKTSTYIGNGKKRVKNMVDFYRNMFPISKKFAKLSGRPNTIIASSVHPLTWLVGYKMSKKFDSKFIVETRDLWPETLVDMRKLSQNGIPARLLYKLEKYIYKKADKLIFTFPGGKDYVASIGIGTSKVRYINNGIDLEDYNHNKIREIYYDSDLNDDKTFKILYTGSMGMANSLNYLIKAAKIINDNDIKNIKFILFGGGYQRDELERSAKGNKIYNVIFKGKVEKKYIPYILSKSSLNVILAEHIDLYKYGLSPNKMFDYMASGKPTLSNIECGYDILEKYNCGITVKGGSAEALAEGILKFYNMPKEEYNVYCKNALKAAQDFDFKILTDKLEKVILED